MRLWVVGAASALAFSMGCPRLPPPSPPAVAMVAVLPPGNRTGDVLLVAGGSVLERYALRSARVTVPDLLQREARDLLRDRGVALVSEDVVATAMTSGADMPTEAAVTALANAGIAGAALRLDVWRWEPDADTHPAFVVVGVEATLIDVASGRNLWHWRPPLHPIATPGAATLGVAYQMASRAAVAELLAAWKHAP